MDEWRVRETECLVEVCVWVGGWGEGSRRVAAEGGRSALIMAPKFVVWCNDVWGI